MPALRIGRRRGAAVALATLLALACGDGAEPGVQTCSAIVALRVPGAEVVEVWPGPRGVALTYRVDGDLHRLECVLTEPAPGRLRAQSLREDQRELSEAEVLLVNSELLLGEIRRADPGPPRSEHWARWLELFRRPFRS